MWDAATRTREGYGLETMSEMFAGNKVASNGTEFKLMVLFLVGGSYSKSARVLEALGFWKLLDFNGHWSKRKNGSRRRRRIARLISAARQHFR